jgi:RNA polymerase sigma-70 factor (ECF subfamily)
LSYSNTTEQTLPVSLLVGAEKPQSAVVPGSIETRFASDEILLSALKNEDREALAELFRRYSRLVFSVGLRILRDPGEADEIVQDVYLFLY